MAADRQGWSNYGPRENNGMWASGTSGTRFGGGDRESFRNRYQTDTDFPRTNRSDSFGGISNVRGTDTVQGLYGHPNMGSSGESQANDSFSSLLQSCRNIIESCKPYLPSKEHNAVSAERPNMSRFDQRDFVAGSGNDSTYGHSRYERNSDSDATSGEFQPPTAQGVNYKHSDFAGYQSDYIRQRGNSSSGTIRSFSDLSNQPLQPFRHQNQQQLGQGFADQDHQHVKSANLFYRHDPSVQARLMDVDQLQTRGGRDPEDSNMAGQSEIRRRRNDSSERDSLRDCEDSNVSNRTGIIGIRGNDSTDRDRNRDQDNSRHLDIERSRSYDRMRDHRMRKDIRDEQVRDRHHREDRDRDRRRRSQSRERDSEKRRDQNDSDGRSDKRSRSKDRGRHEQDREHSTSRDKDQAREQSRDRGSGRGQRWASDRESDKERGQRGGGRDFERGRERHQGSGRERGHGRGNDRDRARSWGRDRDRGRSRDRDVSSSSGRDRTRVPWVSSPRSHARSAPRPLLPPPALPPPLQNQFRNDGSFMEMFQKQMQATQTEKGEAEATTNTTAKASATTTDITPVVLPSPVCGAPVIAKRRISKILKTGMVQKTKKVEGTDTEDKGDAWSRYMQEVKKYRNNKCIEEEATRPLMK